MSDLEHSEAYQQLLSASTSRRRTPGYCRCGARTEVQVVFQIRDRSVGTRTGAVLAGKTKTMCGTCASNLRKRVLAIIDNGDDQVRS